VVDFLATNIAIRLWHLLFGLPLLVVLAVASQVSLGAWSLLLALPSVVLASAVRFVFTYTLAMTAIWTQRAHGAVGMGETLIFLLGGTAAPLTLLPDALRTPGESLPFWSMLGAPAEVAAGTVAARRTQVHRLRRIADGLS
jgi:ABC-2 type transport system permease protein